MTQQQIHPKRSIILPALAVLVAFVAFGAAVYMFDGVSLVRDLVGGFPWESTTPPETDVANPPAQSGGDTRVTELILPDGMSEEFALRIWQEQIDSQTNISRLIDGGISRIVVEEVRREGDQSVLDIVAEFSDGTTAPGRIGMRHVGDGWYFAYVSGMRESETGGFADDTAADQGDAPDSELPALQDVDIAVLNTILQQQVESAAVLEEYATGSVYDLSIEDIVDGTGTVTLKLAMREDHEDATGEIVVISKEIEGKETWFVVRFTKGPSA